MALRQCGTVSRDRVRGLRSRLSRVVRAIGQFNADRRRLLVLASAVDRHLPTRNQAPDTYAEFLFRTSGPLLREPSAKRRAGGYLVG
jgi:hypothetical protein